ncbi:carbohydrate kinase family protein [Mucilaginibacter antarcticus]|uniref:carbohydrate kinase family protein n=1 Tax=Mucilaginibacter antarcticus TaxID=1855725 RepID=UPI003636EFBE
MLCFGEVLWDAFGEQKVAGGATMNVAFHLAQQGAGVTFASSLGTDASGDEMVDFLQDNGLSTDLVQRDKTLPTCEVTVQLDEKQQATYIIPQPVSWDGIKTTPALNKCAKAATAVVFGSLTAREATSRNTLLNLLGETKALKVFDVNLRHPHYTLQTIQNLAAVADVVKMNEEEADLLITSKKGDLKDKINEFRSKYHAQTICVTRGDNGAMVWHDHEFFEHPGFTVDVVDTVGAGDSFLATFIIGLLNKTPMQQTLERACAVGAYVASKRGATPRYVDGVVDLMKK